MLRILRSANVKNRVREARIGFRLSMLAMLTGTGLGCSSAPEPPPPSAHFAAVVPSFPLNGIALTPNGVVIAGGDNRHQGILVGLDSAGKLLWNHGYEATGADLWIASVGPAPGNEVVFCGLAFGPFNLGTGDLGAPDTKSPFVARIDESGTVTWAAVAGQEWAPEACVGAPDGGAVVSGEQYVPAANHGRAAAISPDGQIIWELDVGGSSIPSVVMKSNGEPQLGLQGYGALNVQGNVLPGVGYDYWLLDVDAAGNATVRLHLPRDGTPVAGDFVQLATDASGDIYVAGDVSGKGSLAGVPYDTGQSSPDPWLFTGKLAGTEFEWARMADGYSDIAKLAVSPGGRIAMVGRQFAAMNFDKTPVRDGQQFLARLDRTGSVQGTVAVHESETFGADIRAIAASEDYFWVCGGVQGSIDLTTPPITSTSPNETDGFVAKIIW